VNLRRLAPAELRRLAALDERRVVRLRRRLALCLGLPLFVTTGAAGCFAVVILQS